jgi:hypothetical protein
LAITSLQHPLIDRGRHTKRVVKDERVIGESLAAVLKCDVIKSDTVMNDQDFNSTPFFQCLDVLQLKLKRDNAMCEIKNPTFHDFCSDCIIGLTVSLCDLDGYRINFYRDNISILKLMII